MTDIEEIYRNLPRDLVEKLIDRRLVRQPNEIVDSAEGALMLPSFESKRAFEDYLDRLEEVSAELAAEFRAEAERLRMNGDPPGAGNGGPPEQREAGGADAETRDSDAETQNS